MGDGDKKPDKHFICKHHKILKLNETTENVILCPLFLFGFDGDGKKNQ